MRVQFNGTSSCKVLSSIIFSLFFLGGGSSVMAAAIPKTAENFALPFGLEGIQEVNKKAIPNLVFVVDNSKRSGETLSSGETKLSAYKASINKFIQANSGKYRFGIASLYDIENSPTDVANVMLAHPGQSDTDVLTALASIQVQAYEKAPIITSLSQVYKDVGKSAIIYRCQQSYVYVVSDGDSTGDNDERLKFATEASDGMIFPELAAFTKMKGTYDPYKPYKRTAGNMFFFLDENGKYEPRFYNAGDLLPKSMLARGSGYSRSCTYGATIRSSYGINTNSGAGLCYPQPSPDGYSTYAHFPDQDTYWDNKAGVTHNFDDPEYSVQSIYTSWFSSRTTDVLPAEQVVIEKNEHRAELLVSPETMAMRGRGYYRFISSGSNLDQAFSEVSKKFRSNPALAMGRYYVPDVLLAGYNRPRSTAYNWKDEEQVIYLDYAAAELDPVQRMKLMPILRAVNYPNRWASSYIFSQLDNQGTGKTEKYPDVINPSFAHNDSFAGRDAEIQMLPMSMVNVSSSPHIINTTKGVKVIVDEIGTSSQPGLVDITELSNKEFGIDSEDPNRLKKTWPFYFTLGTAPHFNHFNKAGYIGLSSSKYISFMMHGIRPNTLASYQSFSTWSSEESLYQPITLYDESYEPTTPAMENGVMFANSFLAYGNKQRYSAFFSNNDSSGETGGGTVGMAIGVTRISSENQRQWTDKHHVFYGSTRPANGRLPSFQSGMVSATNNGEVIMMRANSAWGIGGAYVYIPGAIERENNETILQARTRAKKINYGDEDNPFRYVLNGQFAGVETRSYNYAAEKGYTDTYQNIVVGTTGQGGKGVFSLNGQGWLARTGFTESVMTYNGNTVSGDLMGNGVQKGVKALVNWDSAKNPHTGEPMEGLEKIGYTIGQPMLAQMSMKHTTKNVPNVSNDVRILAFIGNGYNGEEEKPSLYVIDAAGADFGTAHELPVSTDEMGKVLKKIQMPVPEDNAKSNALNGVALVDLDFNGVADIGYVGDYNGNLYRLDFRSQTIAGWEATLIYKGDPSQPITTTPTIFKDSKNSVTVIFGTGSQIYKEDSMDTAVQSIYGIKDTYDVVNPKVISYASRAVELTKQDLTEDKTPKSVVRTVTSRPLGSNSGWYMDLRSESKPKLGERIISNMEVTENTLLVTSYYIKPEYLSNQQSEAICSMPMGYAGTWQMQFDAKTGGALTELNANTGKITLASGLSVFSAGEQYMDRIPPVSITTTKNFPYNSQGQVLPGGKLYTPGKVFEPKACDGSDIMISVGNISGGSDTIGGQAIQCAKTMLTSVKRLSWRIVR